MTGYPWSTGDELLAADLNAAIANSVALGGGMLPLTGGTMLGPIALAGNATLPLQAAPLQQLGSVLNYTATGGTAVRAAQDRAGAYLDARDFGIVCDGVTDQGAQLNAAIASTPPGTTIYIPASIYTSQTIRLANGRKLAMPVQALQRPSGGPTLMAGTCAIIGANALSPVVLVQDSDGGLDNVCITRNGTPLSGSIGLQCFGQDHVFWQVRSYNHARCIQVGAPQSAPVNGQYFGICLAFDHCMTWNCTENFVYLLNAPETSFYDCRWGMVGATDPAGAISYVTFDGDNNTTTGAGTTNTVNFLRCQFNSGGGVQYGLRFYNYASPDGGINLTNCYSGGAASAFLYVDPGCQSVFDVKIIGCTISPLSSTETFLSDTGHRLTHLKIIGNRIAGGVAQPAAAFSLSGIPAQVIGNSFGGPFTAQLDAMTGGCFIGNTINTLSVTGAFTGNFVFSGNTYTHITQTATGPLNYLETYGNYGSQMWLGSTGQAGRLDFRRGSDGAIAAWVGMPFAGASGPLTIQQGGGSAVVAINANDPAGKVSLQINGTEQAHAVAGGLRSVAFVCGGLTSGFPTWTVGTGAPVTAQPKGSYYSRTDGAVGSTFYVCQGGSTWNPVAGV